jgi:rod shape-determining protein MreD
LIVARHRGKNWVPVTVVLLASLGATVVPLPGLLEPLRPNFVALTILWLCLLSVRSTGLLLAWGAGLAVDALHGMLLGQNALALVVIAYIALKMRLRIRAFPILHQSVVVFGLLALNEFILFWIDGLAGFPVTAWERWLPVLTGALCWPLLIGLYSRLPIRG